MLKGRRVLLEGVVSFTYLRRVREPKLTNHVTKFLDYYSSDYIILCTRGVLLVAQ